MAATLDPRVDVGHVHLKVADLDRAIAFYRDVLGFELMAALGEQAAFLAAGGYHHHLGANVWESRGAPAAPEGTARLRHATIVLPDAAALDEVLGRVTPGADGLLRDPSGIALRLVAA